MKKENKKRAKSIVPAKSLVPYLKALLSKRQLKKKKYQQSELHDDFGEKNQKIATCEAEVNLLEKIIKKADKSI